MSILDTTRSVVLVAVTAFLFGLVEYRRHRSIPRSRYVIATPEAVNRHQDKVARSRALTRGLEVLAYALAVVAAIVLLVRVTGALL